VNLYFKFRKAFSYFISSKFYKREASLHLTEPIISFTFDDVPVSAIINGERILKKYNFSGTYYISLGLMEQEGFDFKNGDDEMLKKLVEDGGELACHTFRHLHMFKSDKGQIISDLEKNQQTLQQYIRKYRFENFSFPFGEQSVKARKITRNKYKSARSVYQGINSGKVDLNGLKCFRLYESIPLSKIYAAINKAIEINGWLIFYTHDVKDNPSDVGCSPAYFEEVAKYCKEKKLKVLTINDALDFIKK
jgi:peptidoglycan/xylan/chitin deacetylase (PgdA/CDA1 family)